MMFPTASVQHSAHQANAGNKLQAWIHVLNIPSNVRTDARANVSSLSNSSPTSSHAAPKFGLRTFSMWSATVTSKSSSWDRGMARNNVLDQWRDTNITVLTVRWCIIGTYHILIVVTIVIGLSCVGVTVSDQIFHGATECTRHWRETRWVNTDEEEKSVYKKKKTHQLLGHHQAGGRVNSRNRADCKGDWGPGCSVSPRRPQMAPSAPLPEIHQLRVRIWLDDSWNNLRGTIRLTLCRSWSFKVFVQSNWNTMCLANVCLMQRTTYSVSASVSCTGSEDLNSGPRPWNSGMAASCSVKDEKGQVSLWRPWPLTWWQAASLPW